ncbi:MAG: MBOAT family protein [Ruminococcus sp.]|nr:MBOAT family protein [Ruminococcus sp.]
MVFSKLFFVYLFLPLCLAVYAAARGTEHKNTVLIIFSLIFYAWGEPVYVVLMLLSAAVNYAAGLGIGRYRGRAAEKLFSVGAVVFDLLMLGIFKYSGFIAENINAVFSLQLPVPDIRLPIGISFYTFQTISYVIDVSWEEVEPQRRFKNFLMYVSMFPQLVAGPIVRYSTIEREIEDRHVSAEDVRYGLNRTILGLSKKVLLANQLSTVADSFLAMPEKASAAGVWLGAAVYAMQIYFDFSGYSDIAIGLGGLFGFHFDENFRHPFMCRDITEFWQRWHISLGTFFRDYLLYVPIFGKRRKYGGLLLVWLCTGIWHGASWNFVIWGLYYGAFVLFEMLIGKKNIKKIPVYLRHLYSKPVIIVGFAIFYYEDLSKLGSFFRTAFGMGGHGLITLQDRITLSNSCFLLAAALVCCFPLLDIIGAAGKKASAVRYISAALAAPAAAALLILSSLMLVDATTNPFLYFRF